MCVVGRAAGTGAAIEAMLRQQGSATLADIARRFPRCQNLVDVLENVRTPSLAPTPRPFPLWIRSSSPRPSPRGTDDV